MSQQPTWQDIQTTLDSTAATLAQTDVTTWGGWLTYLLEALDLAASDDDFRTTLTNLQRYIDLRLNTGSW